MAEENQKVVVMNACVPVEAQEPLPVKTVAAQPLDVTGKVDVNVVSYPRYEYKAFHGTSYHRREAGSLAGQNTQQVLLKSLEIWLNEGWEIHQMNTHHVNSSLGDFVILRRPR